MTPNVVKVTCIQYKSQHINPKNNLRLRLASKNNSQALIPSVPYSKVVNVQNIAYCSKYISFKTFQFTKNLRLR